MSRRTVKGLLASNKRDAIVAGAVRLFGRYGIDATSMRDIAAEAGITDATLYHYFSGKQELAEAATHSVSFDVDEMKTIVETHTHDLRAMLFAIGEAYLAALAANTAWTRMVIRESLGADGGIAPTAASAVNDLGRRRSTLLARRLESELARDAHAKQRATLAAQQLFYSCTGFWLAEALIGKSTPSAARIRAYLTLVVDGTMMAVRQPRRTTSPAEPRE